MSHSHRVAHDDSGSGNAAAGPGRGRCGGLPAAIVRALVSVIGLYRRAVAPVLPPSCRFVPSCSQYAQAALRRHGVWRGARLAVGRLLRCGPWSAGGFDPVP